MAVRFFLASFLFIVHLHLEAQEVLRPPREFRNLPSAFDGVPENSPVPHSALHHFIKAEIGDTLDLSLTPGILLRFIAIDRHSDNQRTSVSLRCVSMPDLHFTLSSNANNVAAPYTGRILSRSFSDALILQLDEAGYSFIRTPLQKLLAE